MTVAHRSPLVSFIMPVWRPDPVWFDVAIGSVLDQEGCRLELILVDDGNVVPVEDLLNHVDDDRIRVIRIAHAGPNAARNAGITAARGEWIRFVDADDVLVRDSTRHLGSFMNGDAVVAYGATAVADEALSTRYVMATTLQGNVATDCLLGRFETRLPALLFPRAVVEAAGPWDSGFRVNGDWDFVLRALEHASASGDRQIAFYYRRHGDSVTMSANLAIGEAARSRVITRYFDRHPDQRGTMLERRAWAAQHLACGKQEWRARRYLRSLVRLPRALMLDPVGSAPEIARFAVREARRRKRLSNPGNHGEQELLHSGAQTLSDPETAPKAFIYGFIDMKGRGTSRE